MIRSLAVIAGTILFAIASDTQASADTIGQAASTKNIVTGVIGALEQALTTGDKVSGNETVKTGIKSAALLQFLDNSKLNIGASSTVLLDRFVYNPDASARNGIVKLTAGALRFASGGHEAKNFAIATPVATLVARGTDFAVICDGSRCVALMATGKLKVCPHPSTPATRPKALANCPNSYGLDQHFNFTLVGPGGENSGPRRIDPSIVSAVIASIARGDRNPSTARLAALASANLGAPPSSQNGSSGIQNGLPSSPPSPHPPTPPTPPGPPPPPPPPPPPSPPPPPHP